MVTICTASLTFNNSTFCPHSVFMCFVWISEQTAIISLYNINWLVYITKRKCVYCAVRVECLYTIKFAVFEERNTNSQLYPGTAHNVLAATLLCQFLSIISPDNEQHIQNPTALSRTYTPTQHNFMFPRNCAGGSVTCGDSTQAVVCIITRYIGVMTGIRPAT